MNYSAKIGSVLYGKRSFSSVVDSATPREVSYSRIFSRLSVLSCRAFKGLSNELYLGLDRRVCRDVTGSKVRQDKKNHSFKLILTGNDADAHSFLW
jgi:hypothetical protein